MKRWLAIALLLLLCIGAAAGCAQTFRSISCAGRFSAVVDEDGVLYTMGRNECGQLGKGKVHSRSQKNPPAAVMEGVQSVSCGFYHLVILKENGRVYACGKNEYGAVGDGTTQTASSPVWIDLMDVRAIGTGDDHTLAIAGRESEVYVWGRNQKGQLGTGDTRNRLSPVSIGLQGAVSVAAGDFCSAALMNDGTVMTWGEGIYGELGNGKKQSSKEPVRAAIMDVVSISVGDSNMAAVTADGELYVWGRNDYGQCGLPRSRDCITTPTLIMDNVSSVSCGDKHTAVVTMDNALYTFGANEFGQLANGKSGSKNTKNMGNGKSPYVAEPTKVLEGVRSVSCGYAHTIVTMLDGTIAGFGDNSNGQLSLKSLNR